MFSRSQVLHIVFLIFILFSTLVFSQTNNEIFENMVGQIAALDKDVTVQLLHRDPGEKILIDSNRDGRIDILYKIDTDERHKNERSPLVVKIIDEDGDMYLTGEGDLDSDLYVADWYGDGTIDRVIDYIDLDNDNDVDEQVLYQWSDMAHFLAQASKNYDGKAYCAVWTKDYGDDNRLWYDINYEYNQRTTQWLTDFNGDEIFVYAFFYNFEENTFSAGFENPFAFYDLDGDSFSEEVVRLGASDFVINSLRYSMDIDNDTRGSNRHDYDFSISALGPVSYEPETCMTINLRGIETGHIITWENVRPIAKAGIWSKIHLTWDENDNNIDPVQGRQHNERWEGIISYGNEYIRQVGGPSCGAYNKRNEVDMDGSGNSHFYYSTVDQRLHLYGAEVGWIKADYDYDEHADMQIFMEDTDGNGFFDTWKYDANADSIFERVFNLTNDEGQVYQLDYLTLHELYLPSIEKAVKDNQKMLETIKPVLMKYEENFSLDNIEEYFRTSLVTGYNRGFSLGQKVKNSDEGTRYYGDLMRERYWFRLLKTGAVNDSNFPDIRDAYENGLYDHTADLIEQHFLKEQVIQPYKSYEKCFMIELTNPVDMFLENHPLILDIETIRNKIRDFNPLNYEIVEGVSRIDWRSVASQVDDLNGDNKPDELAFVHSLLPMKVTNLRCWYSPEGIESTVYPQKTDTHRDWLDLKVNIGWESNLCGYRMYYGQIDFFGKRRESLILKTNAENYHLISDWGMDVLHVGQSSGLGGISIWNDSERIPVMNPVGKGNVGIERSIIASGPVRSLVRVDFSNVRSSKGDYTVSMLMSAFADNRFSQQNITVTSSLGDTVMYSPGVMKLKNDNFFLDSGSGILTCWGYSDDVIKDIGMGLMFEPGEYEGYAESEIDRYIKLKIPSGERRTHWIIGGWRKGLANPVAPTARDWAKQVDELGRQLRVQVGIRYLSR
ncbi:MAG: DUF4861 family protein [Candidatus Latescibacteria bacterium]|nr:DUF4861 family protein [Candidatus Latescibacterota bacterium]